MVGETWTAKDDGGVVVTGARVSVEGVTRVGHGKLVVWNPWYDIEAPPPGRG